MHFICPQCSQDAFTIGCKCPVCAKKLTINDVHEITIGLESTLDTTDIILQNLLKSSNWENILQNYTYFLQDMTKISSFITKQLYLELIKGNTHTRECHQEINELKEELVSILL